MQILAERVEADGVPEVGHRIGVVGEPVVGHAAIMISANIQRMNLQSAREVIDGTAIVAEIVFCYSAKEICFKIVGFR